MEILAPLGLASNLRYILMMVEPLRTTRSDSGSAALQWHGAALLVFAWSLFRPVYFELASSRAIGVVISLGGALLLVLGAGRGKRRTGLALASSMLVVCGVVDALALRIEAMWQPRLLPFTFMAGWLSGLVGAHAVVEGGDLILDNPEGGFVFSPTLGTTMARPLFLFWVAGCLILLARRSRPNWQILLPIGFSLVAFGFRYGLGVLSFAGRDYPLSDTQHLAMTVFWDPYTTLAALLASAVLSALADRDGQLTVRWGRAGARNVLWAAFGGVGLGAMLGWSDPGEPKLGRVLIDDRLSGPWEPAGRLLTEDRFGDFSAYSFSAMVEHLSRRFAVSINADQQYTPELLSDVDVLVLKTPQEALRSEEIASIHQWVAKGGGLFAIGDHTDLGGMGSHLNQVIGRLGIMFRFDATANSANSGFDVWKAPWIHEHPVSAELEPFGLMTGCSLLLSGVARPVLTVKNSTSTRGDYSLNSNFGGRAPDPRDAHGALVVAAASTIGRGRVLAFADSTVLSSFAYYMDSHAAFVLRSVAWLNGANGWGGWLDWAFLVVGLLGVGRTLLGRPEGLDALAACIAGAVAGVLSARAFAHVASAGLTVPAPDQLRRVGICVDGGHAWLPPVLGTRPDLPPNGDYSTFVQTPQRLGFETEVIPRDPSKLAGLDLLLVINPDAENSVEMVPEGWTEAVRDWVVLGGGLVVLSRSEHLGHDHDHSRLYVEGPDHKALDVPEPGIKVTIGICGMGRILHVSGSELLDTDALGHCMALPGQRELRRYETAFSILRAASKEVALDRRTFLPDVGRRQ